MTLDESLDLLFDPSLIPNEVRSQLHSDLHVRPLASTDYTRSHLSVLSVLSPSPNPANGLTAYQAHFASLKSCPNTYFTLVIVNRSTDKIVGVGALFVEKKFLRGLSIVGHIEDIAVDTKEQGKKVGLRIIQALVGISEGLGCYKTILNCSDKNVPFYEKCGFQKKENEMARYAPEKSRL